MVTRALHPTHGRGSGGDGGLGGAGGGAGDLGAGGASGDLAALARLGRDATPTPRRQPVPRPSCPPWRDWSSKHRWRGRCALTTVEDPAGLPAELRRLDGASVFTVAGTEQYTSLRILAAEQRLLDAAHRTDGHALNPIAVDLGLVEAAANGLHLDAGQAAMVQTLATDRRRVQLVIAPAGAGKTTALKVLADTWTGGGGHILGLAPSAAAAHQLQQATGMPADTLRPAQLGPRPRSTRTGLGRGDRAEDAAGGRRGRDGRHPHPRHRHRPRPRPGWAGLPGRGRPATRRRRTLRHPHRPARRPRRPPPHPAAPVLRSRRSRRHPPDPRRPPRRTRLLHRPRPHPHRRPRRPLPAAAHRLADRPEGRAGHADARPQPSAGRRPQPAGPRAASGTRTPRAARSRWPTATRRASEM